MGGEAADDFAAEAVEYSSRVELVRESAEPAFEVRVGRDENMFFTTCSSPSPRSSARADALMSVTFEGGQSRMTPRRKCIIITICNYGALPCNGLADA
jgi:hypothetical protein